MSDRAGVAQRHFRKGVHLVREMPEMSVGEARTAGAIGAIPWATHRRSFIVATVAAPLLAIMGAFNTGSIPILPRLLYWLILMESGALIGLAINMLADSLPALKNRRWLKGAFISVGIALPLSLMAIGLSGLFFETTVPGLEGLLIFFLLVLMVCVTITAITMALDVVRQQPDTETPSPTAQPSEPVPAAQRLLDRLPAPHRAGPIHALEAEDHYLRVHTAHGSTLVLMRISDAMAEIEGIDGAQTHRSWWVARSAVEAVDRGDGRATLQLTGGVSAPVSRAHYKALRDRGWF